MRFASVATCLWFTLLLSVSELPAREAIRLATAPALSPDGATLAFAWRGDIWLVSSGGGVARPWSTHPGRDSQPHFSPDGTRIAFTSQRTGTRQVFVGHVSGGFATQVTFHSEGTSVAEWFPDGQSLLVEGQRDHSFVNPQRLFRVNVTKRAGEELLFDAAAADGAISPDGRKILFTREGVSWWRKGYRGSEASQIWLYDTSAGEFSKLVDQERGGCNPLWQPDGKAFYYVGAQNGSFNLWRRDLTSGKQRRLTDFSDDSVLMPCISRDGSTIVFRHLFDFYRLRPGSGKPPQRLDIYCDSDVEPEPVVRRDAGIGHRGELFLRWPGVGDDRRRQPLGHGHRALRAASDHLQPGGGALPRVCPRRQVDPVRQRHGGRDRHLAGHAGRFPQILVAKRPLRARAADAGRARASRICNGAPPASGWPSSKGGATCGSWIPTAAIPPPPGALEPSRLRVVADGKWLAYAVYDNDFNRDIWVLPVDGSRPPVNLSCHPSIDDNPAWSPDGRIIAFTGTAARAGGGHLFRLPAEGGRRGRRPRSGRATGRGETPQGAVAARGRRLGAGGQPGGAPARRPGRRKTVEQGPAAR